MNFLKFRYFRMLYGLTLIERCNPAYILLTRSHIHHTSLKLLGCPHITYQVCNYAKKVQGKVGKGGKAKTVHLTEEEISEVIDLEDYKNKLLQIKEKLKRDYVEHLSLRSAAGGIDNIIVKLENEDYPLHELAQISKKNQNLIAINMSDFPEAIKPAVQAIIDSGLGINPQQEGTMLYLAMPKLTREHRENLAKNAKSIFTRAKDDVRNVQNNFVRDAKKQTDLAEDLVFYTTNHIMAMAKEAVNEMEKILKTKQNELLGES